MRALGDGLKNLQRNSGFLLGFSSLYKYSPKLTAQTRLELSARWPHAGSGRALVRVGVRKIRRNAVLISGFGRLGNSIVQLLNGIELGKAIGAREFLYFRYDAIDNQRIDLGETGQLRRLPIRGKNRASAPDLIWQTDAIFASGGVLFDPCADSLSATREALSSSLGSGIEEEPEPHSTCTIHLRGGDIFGPSPHPGYGQPPWGYYERILESQTWGRVVLVAEDSLNPCVEKIEEWCAARGVPMTRVGETLDSAISAIRRASVLAMSVGTFVPAILLLGGNAEKAFWFGEEPSELVCVNKLEVALVRDLEGQYTSSIMQGNWANSPSQRDLMVTYDKSRVSRPSPLIEGRT